MTVSTTEGIWVVPPLRAVWIPAFTNHQVDCSGRVLMRTLFIEQDILTAPITHCCVISVSPLLRELILYATEMPKLYDVDGPDGRIVQVILDCMHASDVAPLDLPVPGSEKLKKVLVGLTKNPADQRTLDQWADSVGLTGKTLARHIQSELNLTFGQWRQQIRLLEAMRRLGQNQAVTLVAMDLGYDSPSAFIAMFKKALGSTPGQYFKMQAGGLE